MSDQSFSSVERQRPQPFRCSALYRRHLALGATMTERYGWRTAEHFTAPSDEARRVCDSVGLADVSWLGKLDSRGTPAEHVSSRLERTFSAPSARSEGLARVLPRQVWHLAHEHALVTCSPDERGRIESQLSSPREEEESGVRVPVCLHVTDVTSVYAALLLAGPRSREVLHKLTAIDVGPAALPNRAALQVGLAEVHAILLRADLGAASDLPVHWLLMGREYGEYLWDAVMHAGQGLGITPFGVAALDTLGESLVARP